MGKGKPATLGDKKMFFDTIRDMRNLIQKNSNNYVTDVLGMSKKKSTKVPYNHLMGRRKSLKSELK